MADTSKKGVGQPPVHGGYSSIWKKAVKGDLDGRSVVSRAVRELRSALVADMGGEGNLSTQKALILDRAVAKVFKCQAIETALYEGKELSPNTMGLYLALSNSLRKDLTSLGLRRVARRIGEEPGAVNLDKLSLAELDQLYAMRKRMEAEKEKK